MTDTVLCERRARTLIVSIDRPHARNAVDSATGAALAAAFRDFDADAALDVAILTGTQGTFCAGADLKAVASGEPSQRSRTHPHDGHMGPTRMLLGKPVLAAVEGHAVAGGLELALWCDLRVCEDDAVLGVFCRRWGVPLIDGGTVRLPRVVGLGRALDLILTGRPVLAEEALAMGLVNRVVPRGTSRAAAEGLAREIAAFPEVCARNDRRSAYESLDLPLAAALQREFELGGDTIARGTLAGAERFAAGAGRGGRFGE